MQTAPSPLPEKSWHQLWKKQKILKHPSCSSGIWNTLTGREASPSDACPAGEGSPCSSDSGWNREPRPSRISPLTKRVPGIFPAEWHLFRVWMTARYRIIITKSPLTPNWMQLTRQILWLFTATSISDWSQLALWFYLFHRELTSSWDCHRSRPQQYRMFRVDSTPQKGNWIRLLELIYNYTRPSAIIHLQFILLDSKCHHLYGPALVDCFSSV